MMGPCTNVQAELLHVRDRYWLARAVTQVVLVLQTAAIFSGLAFEMAAGGSKRGRERQCVR